jgi:hypothetical protein
MSSLQDDHHDHDDDDDDDDEQPWQQAFYASLSEEDRPRDSAPFEDSDLEDSMGTLQDGAHDLMPDWFVVRMPPLYSQEGTDDPIVQAKFFTPDSSWTWYVVEYYPAERLCFGLVDGFERELGYFSVDELESVRGPLGLRIERDLYWKPCLLSQVRGK